MGQVELRFRVLQCVAVWCSGVQCVAVGCRGWKGPWGRLKCVAMCCSGVQWGAGAGRAHGAG